MSACRARYKIRDFRLKRRMKMLDSRKKANQKWLKANYESITIRVPKGTKDKIKAWAAARNISMASYIQEACKEKSEKSP